jgi:hypothetical protein
MGSVPYYYYMYVLIQFLTRMLTLVTLKYLSSKFGSVETITFLEPVSIINKIYSDFNTDKWLPLSLGETNCQL